MYVAPPLGGYGGYGGYGYGMGGFGMPPVVIAGGPVVGFGGFSLFGSLFQFFAIAAAFQLLLTLVSSIGSRKGSQEDDDADTL